MAGMMSSDLIAVEGMLIKDGGDEEGDEEVEVEVVEGGEGEQASVEFVSRLLE